jgi:HEAT repeat protein
MQGRARLFVVLLASMAVMASGCGRRGSGPSRSETIEKALKDLKNANAKERVSATMTLAQHAGAKEVPALVAVLKEDPEGMVRAAAASALGQINEPACLDPLIAAIKDPEPGVAQAAVGALRTFNDPKAIAALEEAQRDGRAEVRDLAREILTAIKEEGQPPP